MKIVQINAVYGFASTGRTTKELHEYLLSNNIDSYVFCATSLKIERNVYLMGGRTEHKIHSFLAHSLGLEGYFSSISTHKLINDLQKIKPDVVILRNLHSHYINFPLLLKYLGKNDISSIIVLHDVWPFTGLCTYYTEVNCDKWKTGCGKCTYLKENGSWFFDRTSKVFKDKENFFKGIQKLAVVGVSQWVADEARCSPIFTNAKKITHIYNWIDFSVFYPRDTKNLRNKLNLSENDFIILGVAQFWSEKKGYSQYFNLAKELSDIKVILVGKKEKEENLPENLICVPPTNSTKELAEYYSMADVYLNLSVQETFGKVSAEAISCGTPLIAYNSTANPEICGEGCGYLLNNRCYKEAIPHIYTIKRNGKKYYTNKCLSFARQMFSKDNNIQKYLELIAGLNS